MKKYQSIILSILNILLLTACTVSTDNDDKRHPIPSLQDEQTLEESVKSPTIEQDTIKPQVQKKSSATFEQLHSSPAAEQVLPVISEEDDMPRLD